MAISLLKIISQSYSYFSAFKVFTIQCSAPRPDGIHAPFKILSTITLIALRDVVAEKMGRHPKTVRLQYRLDSDKAKQASTSIHSNDELDIFIGRLQDLIVPGCLPSGHKSTRAPKNPVVHFEDTSFGNGGSAHPSKGVSMLRPPSPISQSFFFPGCKRFRHVWRSQAEDNIRRVCRPRARWSQPPSQTDTEAPRTMEVQNPLKRY